MDKLKKKIVIAEQDITTETILKTYLDGDVLFFKTLNEAVSFILTDGADLLIVDIDGKNDDYKILLDKLINAKSNCRIVALTYNRSVNIIFELLRQGVDDFVYKPVLKSVLLEKINKIFKTSQNSNLSNSKNKIISVFSNKGGLGKTSVAINLAYELYRISKKKILILDLNFQNGDINTFLKISQNFDIEYFLKNMEKINADLLYNLLPKYKDNELYVMSDKFDSITLNKKSTEKVFQLIKILQKYFAYIVVDTPQNFDQLTMATLGYSDCVFLVSNINMPTLHNTKKCLDLFHKKEIPDNKVKILVNRCIDNSEMLVRDMERRLNKKVYRRIPNDYITQLHAINSGKCVAELDAKAKLAQTYKDMAIDLVDKN